MSARRRGAGRARAGRGLLSSALVGIALTLLPGRPVSAEPPALEAAYARFAEAVAEAGRIVQRHPFYAEPRNRASAHAFVTGMLIATLEEDLVQDPDQPFFRVLDQRIREGGDNPDQRYLFSTIRGDATYRIWGRLGRQRGLELQVYAGEPWRRNGGRSVSSLAFEAIHFDDDGRFEIFLSPDADVPPAKGRDWLANAPDATELIVRQVFSDWKNETPGEVHIDRVGYEGRAKPVATEAAMAARLEKAAADLTRTVATWPDFVLHRYMEAQPANTLSSPADPKSVGGVVGRFMSTGHFALAEGEALIVTVHPIGARYQGIQLADPWFSSLEYANRVTSLSADQARPSADGAYRFVVAAEDPGVQNWLDTTGLPKGAMLIRFDGSGLAKFPADRLPSVEKVPLARVRERLPKDTPGFDAEARSAQLAERRRHVQIRYGN